MPARGLATVTMPETAVIATAGDGTQANRIENICTQAASCLCNVGVLHISTMCKNAQVYKDVYDLDFCVLSSLEETFLSNDGQRLTKRCVHRVYSERCHMLQE